MKVVQVKLNHCYFLPSSIRFLGRPLKVVYLGYSIHSLIFLLDQLLFRPYYQDYTISPYTMLALEILSSHCPTDAYVIPSKGYAVSAVICVVLL